MNSKIYKGSLEPIILKLLTEHQAMYGYEITKAIKNLTKNEIQVKEGSLYPLLHRMEADGVIESYIKNMGNRNRKYYKITEEGQHQAASILEEMNQYLRIMQSFFGPTHNLSLDQ
ncbi:PadR family transcriptional regulator [Portibacter marinus]|uniref:PadR family transcriptional regulator n=1 Tax=Portibacter marinus TaxID=2898660 RepID=UPI001F17271E|nr:PadR family transcriptional regulator [Portibacter marinus]